MTATRLIKKKNATIAVTANADIMFAPGGQVYGWTRRLANAIEKGTEAEAPVNKRPRWGHYGKPLKSTISSATPRFIRHARGPRVYAAVGSSAKHAVYVDQGTGIYNGASPWKAKVLPPYREGSPSLYEASWHPPGQQATHTVMIKGQKGQFFFDKGLQRGFQKMRMRSYQRPSIDPRMGDILRTWPKTLENFAGNTPADAAFIASLEQWRLWRDEAFNKGRVMGVGHNAERQRRRARAEESASRRRMNREWSRARRAERSKVRSQERRDRIKAAKSTEKAKARVNKPRKTREQVAVVEAKKVMAAWLLKHPNGKILNYNKDGFNYELRKGNQIIRKGQPWGIRIVDLFYGRD